MKNLIFAHSNNIYDGHERQRDMLTTVNVKRMNVTLALQKQSAKMLPSVLIGHIGHHLLKKQRNT